MLRRETPRKRCPGGREDARGAVCYTADLKMLGDDHGQNHPRKKPEILL